MKEVHQAPAASCELLRWLTANESTATNVIKSRANGAEERELFSEMRMWL